jgi:hypothetical protein
MIFLEAEGRETEDGMKIRRFAEGRMALVLV